MPPDPRSNRRHKPVNWAWEALREHPHFLARRGVGTDEWIIAAGRSPAASLAAAVAAPRDRTFFGHLGYHHAGVIDRSITRHAPIDGSPTEDWRVAEWVLRGDGDGLEPMGTDPVAARWAEALLVPGAGSWHAPRIDWQVTTPRARYLDQVRRVLAHIQRGDVYELNYCTRRSAHVPGFDPFAAFARLLAHADAPYAAFYRQGDRFALCASPEHYLRVDQRELTTRPMKGTRRRDADPVRDAALADALANDPKERSENIMAVDVARNDLGRVAAAGSVRVPELCVVKSHPHVHQMVSTVSATLRPDANAWDAVRASFPMASMTGAPKRRAMELIDDLEDQARGLFSGALGLYMPDGTLDLNVVIRTLTYNAATGVLSLLTGSAITAQSDPEQEWEECELKARSVINALDHAR